MIRQVVAVTPMLIAIMTTVITDGVDSGGGHSSSGESSIDRLLS